MPSEHPVSEELFWRLAADLGTQDARLGEGRIMSSRCLRLGKEFLAMIDRRTGALVVKLPRNRVDQLKADEIGEAFAPAGKVFKEWVAVPTVDEVLWRDLLEAGIAFVGGEA